MGLARSTAGVRQQLWLLLAVVAVALSVLAMHQLSSNHTAAGSTTGAAAHMHPAVMSGDNHHLSAGRHGHADPIAARADLPLTSDQEGCPGCAGHAAMAMTCLAALILLAVGWALAGPRVWRGVRLPRPQPRVVRPTYTWRPRSRSLTELAISRT